MNRRRLSWPNLVRLFYFNNLLRIWPTAANSKRGQPVCLAAVSVKNIFPTHRMRAHLAIHQLSDIQIDGYA